MCIPRATVSAVSCLVVPAFISIDLLISLVLKIKMMMMMIAAATAAGHSTMPASAAPQRHLANRHGMRVSGSDSYALLFFFTLHRHWQETEIRYERRLIQDILPRH